jgi:hypothetical protein
VTAVRPHVRLRPYDDGDHELLRGILGDPDMTRFLGGPESDAALVARHARYVSADPLTNGLYAIALPDEHRAVAVCESLGFTLLGEVEVEYPKGHIMRSVHWRYDLQPSGQQTHRADGASVV